MSDVPRTSSQHQVGYAGDSEAPRAEAIEAEKRGMAPTEETDQPSYDDDVIPAPVNLFVQQVQHYDEMHQRTMRRLEQRQAIWTSKLQNVKGILTGGLRDVQELQNQTNKIYRDSLKDRKADWELYQKSMWKGRQVASELRARSDAMEQTVSAHVNPEANSESATPAIKPEILKKLPDQFKKLLDLTTSRKKKEPTPSEAPTTFIVRVGTQHDPRNNRQYARAPAVIKDAYESDDEGFVQPKIKSSVMRAPLKLDGLPAHRSPIRNRPATPRRRSSSPVHQHHEDRRRLPFRRRSSSYQRGRQEGNRHQKDSDRRNRHDDYQKRRKEEDEKPKASGNTKRRTIYYRREFLKDKKSPVPKRIPPARPSSSERHPISEPEQPATEPMELSPARKEEPTRVRFHRSPVDVAALRARQNTDERRQNFMSMRCIFCYQLDHFIKDCPNSTIKDRLSLCNVVQYCSTCAALGHNSSKCESPYKRNCSRCAEKGIEVVHGAFVCVNYNPEEEKRWIYQQNSSSSSTRPKSTSIEEQGSAAQQPLSQTIQKEDAPAARSNPNSPRSEHHVSSSSSVLGNDTKSAIATGHHRSSPAKPSSVQSQSSSSQKPVSKEGAAGKDPTPMDLSRVAAAEPPTATDTIPASDPTDADIWEEVLEGLF